MPVLAYGQSMYLIVIQRSDASPLLPLQDDNRRFHNMNPQGLSLGLRYIIPCLTWDVHGTDILFRYN